VQWHEQRNDESEKKPTRSLAEIQVEAAKRGVKVIDGSARFKAIGIVGGSHQSSVRLWFKTSENTANAVNKLTIV